MTYPVPTYPVPPEWAVYVGPLFRCTVTAWTEDEAQRLADEAVGTTTTVERIPF
jgi:hypothetical protein